MSCSDSNNWIKAMQEDFKSMQDNEVWELVDLPENFKPAGCKWVFKTTRDSRGNVEQFKNRLVAKGYPQHEGLI